VVKLIELHATAKRVGNSWAILIPKEQADKLDLRKNRNLHVDISIIPKLQELKGTLKTKKSTEQIMREIDEGWD
jgi:antitoxin component of MazEF toxin-antitoxin module